MSSKVNGTTSISLFHAPVWEKATSLHPKFAEAYDLFTYKLDRFGGPFSQMLHLTAEDYYIACLHTAEELSACHIASPNIRGDNVNLGMSSKPFPLFMAVRVQFPRSACNANFVNNNSNNENSNNNSNNTNSNTSNYQENKKDVMVTSGSLSLLTDNMTSFHVALAELPNALPHASVSIQTNYHEPIYGNNNNEEENNTEQHYVIISRIDKLGRRIMYLTCYVIHDDYHNSHLDSIVIDRLQHITNTQELQEWLDTQNILAMVHHVKSIISSSHAPAPTSTTPSVSSTNRSSTSLNDANEIKK